MKNDIVYIKEPESVYKYLKIYMAAVLFIIYKKVVSRLLNTGCITNNVIFNYIIQCARKSLEHRTFNFENDAFSSIENSM